MGTYKLHFRLHQTSNYRHSCILIFLRESICLKISVLLSMYMNKTMHLNKYDSTGDYEAVFWIMNLLSLQWIPSNISEHLHPKVPFPYNTHVPPFLQYASPLGLHLSNQNQVIIIKTILINVSKITYLFHIGYHRRAYYNCMRFFHHSLQHTFHHFYKNLRCLESICLFEKKAQYLNHFNN